VSRRAVLLLPYAVFLLLAAVSWNRWIEPYVDTGRELMVPWRVAQGETLYRDVRFYYGPLAPWLAAGVDPGQAILFIQSQVPEHAELHLLLSMIAPLGWLERVPTYKDQQEKLADKDLTTYGFLGYPLLQSADILIYRAKFVPVGEDQVPHVEFTREVARRFNHLFGKPPGFEEKAEEAIRRLGSRRRITFRRW